MKNPVLTLGTAALIAVGTGCASVGVRLDHTLTGNPPKLGVYPGVRTIAKCPLLLPDLPGSFLVDTIALSDDLKH